jgi:hypothetical protein
MGRKARALPPEGVPPWGDSILMNAIFFIFYFSLSRVWCDSFHR